MNADIHRVLIGVFFAVHAVIYSFSIALVVLLYGGMGTYFALGYGKRSEQGLGIFFIVMTAIVVAIASVIVVPQILAAFKLLRNKGGARFWAIFAAITALISFPFGTAIGIYALIILFGEQGRQLEGARAMPPPPPSNWQ